MEPERKFCDAVDAYIEEAGRLRTPSSVTSFRKVMNTLQKHTDAVTLSDIDQHALTDWCLSNSPAPSTVKKRRAHARSFFGWCAYKGWVETDPSSGLGYSVVPGRGSVRTHTWLSKEELRDLILLMPSDEAGERDRLILLLGSLCGLRAEEICQLRWMDFSSDWSQLTLVGKGGKPAVIGVPRELRAALRAWHRKRPVGAIAVLPTMRSCTVHGERVRVAQWNMPIQYTGVLRAVKAAGERGGWKLDPHDLRRTFAGILEETGVPVTDIQRMMRHNDVGTTSRYLDKNPRRTVELADALELGL